MAEITADARYALLSGLIDDAALYPPAQLGLAEALTAHLAHLDGEHAWMTGCLVVPASRLAELDDLLPQGRDLELSVVLDASGPDFADGVRADLARIVATERPERLAVCSVEVRMPQAAAAVAALVDALMDHGLAGRVDAYAEIDIAGRPAAELAAAVGALAAAQRRVTDRARGLVATVVGHMRASRSGPAGTADAGRLLAAKVRCGGEAVPTPAELAGFLLACGRAGVTYKATAGLHHPHPRLDPDSGELVEHGLLAVAAAGALVAAAAARAPRSGSRDLSGGGAARARYAPPPEEDAEMGLATLVAVLSDPGPRTLSAEGLVAAERSLDAGLLARWRHDGLLAVGSCSIDETVADLVELGVLTGDGRLA